MAKYLTKYGAVLPVPPHVLSYSTDVASGTTGIALRLVGKMHGYSRVDQKVYVSEERGASKLLQTIMEDTWYKLLKDAYKFYTEVTASQFMTHIIITFYGLHVINISNIPMLIQGLWTKANNIPEYTNML